MRKFCFALVFILMLAVLSGCEDATPISDGAVIFTSPSREYRLSVFDTGVSGKNQTCIVSLKKNSETLAEISVFFDNDEEPFDAGQFLIRWNEEFAELRIIPIGESEFTLAVYYDGEYKVLDKENGNVQVIKTGDKTVS